MAHNKATALKEFRQVPGVGASIAEDFWNIGLRSLADLEGRDAESLYQQLCNFQQCQVDRCMLYVFRCAIYYASNNEYDPELLKWWNWKNRP